MNVKQTQKALKAIGVKVKRIEGEWQISHQGASYFTTDNDDAYGTALAMVRQTLQIVGGEKIAEDGSKAQ